MLKLIHAPVESRCPETRQGHAVTDCCMQQSWRFQPRLPPGDGHAPRRSTRSWHPTDGLCKMFILYYGGKSRVSG